MSIKSAVQAYLSSQPHKAGETVQFGWFIFRVIASGQPPQIESLDFRGMMSFTEDFSEAERIHALQSATLARFGATALPCTLRQSALVSLSYHPGRRDAFLKREQPSTHNDSGWYVGVEDEARNMADESSFALRSLYELTIHDLRMAPYWLLPEGTFVALDDVA